MKKIHPAEEQETMSYRQLRQKNQDQTDLEKLSFDIEDNKLQLEADLRETERSLTLERRTLQALKSKEVLSTGEILKQQDLIRGLEEGVEAVKALIKELF